MPTIAEIKEQEITETPLLLFDCELPSGVEECWSTHEVSAYGKQYKARVLRHNLFEIRSASEDGIDTVSRVSITLANADSYFSQIDRNVGWKGAKLTVRFVFFDLQNASPASEDAVLFRGVANPADEITESTFRLTFSNRLGLQRVLLPDIRIQRRCPWTFPASDEQRSEAVDGGTRGKFSLFYRCGYSPGVPGGCGNLDAGAPFATCDYTRVSAPVQESPYRRLKIPHPRSR